jgi:hypothetical protein
MSVPSSRRRLSHSLFILASVVWLACPVLPAQTEGQLKALYAQSELVVSGTISEALPFTSGISAMWSVRMTVNEVFKGDPALKGQEVLMQADLLPASGVKFWKAPPDGGANYFKTGEARVLFLQPTRRSSPVWEVIPTSVPSEGSQVSDHTAQISVLRRLQVEAWPFK